MCLSIEWKYINPLEDFPHQAVYWHTKELTQETNLMNVMFVRRDFPSHTIY